MARHQRREIVPGLFVLAAGAVFALFAFRVGRWEVLDFLKGDRLLCRSVFDEVKTLSVGARVVVSGRSVGVVDRLAWTEREYTPEDLEILRRRLGTLPPGIGTEARRLVVQVDFELTDETLRLDRETARVTIRQDGFLGQHYIDLYPGFWPAEMEPPTILAAGYEEPLLLPAHAAGGLELLTATVADAVASLDALITTLNEGVLSPANRENLGAMLGSLRGAAEDMRGMLGEGGGLRTGLLEPFQQLLESATAALATLREDTLPGADRLMAETSAGAAELRESLAAVQGDLRQVLDQLEATLVDTRPALADAVQRLRGALWQAEMAMRRIRADPSVLLWGAEQADLEARERDESGVRATGRARIYRQRDERVEGR